MNEPRCRAVAMLGALMILATTTPAPTAAPAAPGPSTATAPAIVARPAFYPIHDALAGRPWTLVLPLPTAALGDAVRSFRTRYGIPGLQVAITWADGRSWTSRAGFADVASRERPTDATPFSVGSVTKTFVAALTLALVDEGRFGLDQPVAPLLRGVLVGKAPLDRRITVRMLLSHTSGLYDYFLNPTIDRALHLRETRRWTPARSLAFVRSPYFEPGAGWHYSNTNYLLLGLLAERTTGRTLASLLRDRFFAPLGLASTFLQDAEAPPTPVARAYGFRGTSRPGSPIALGDGTAIAPYTSVVTAAGAAGAVASSATDLARWARALYAGSVLSPAMLAAMEDTSSATGGRSAAYGLGMRRNRIGGYVGIGHSGRLEGASVSMRYFPALGVTIAVTTNQWRTSAERLMAALVPLAASAVWPPPEPPGGGDATSGVRTT